MKRKVMITKDNERLLAFLNASASAEERADKITDIAKGCFVTRQVVYNWMFGKTRIPTLHKHKIEEIFGKQVFFEFQPA